MAFKISLQVGDTEKKSGDNSEGEKKCQYFIDRFRQLGSSAGKWGLLFFAALLYTWVVSIEPKKAFIVDYFTSKQKELYFDSLLSQAGKSRIKNINTFKVRLNKFDSILSNSSLVDSGFINQTKLNSENIEANLKKTNLKKKERWDLKESLALAISEKGFKKDSIKDTIKKLYYPLNVLIARAELQRTEAKNQKDSLINKANIVFNVPSLSAINLGFKAGLIFWMLLLLIFIGYFFSVRLKMMDYLKRIAVFRKHLNSTDSFDKMDLQVPFWFAPVTFARGEDYTSYINLVGWKFIKLQNLLCISFLLLVVSLQCYVGWISWHLSAHINFDISNGFKFLTILLTTLTIMLFLLWLQPVNMSPAFETHNYTAPDRRKFVKTLVSSTLFMLLIPTIGKALPLLKAVPLGYRRKDKKFAIFSSDLAYGFYSHKHKRRRIIHYYYNGYSPSFKNILPGQKAAFEKRLQPFNLLEHISSGNEKNIHISNWQYVLEAEALRLINNGDCKSGIEMILFALIYSTMQQGNQIRNTQIRLINLLYGTMFRFEQKLAWQFKHQQLLAKRKDVMQEIIKNDTLISKHIPDVTKKSFKLKWERAGTFPWTLPGLVFISKIHTRKKDELIGSSPSKSQAFF